MLLDGQNKINVHFNPDGTFNGYQSWLSDDSTIKIIWDTTLSCWKLSGSTLGTSQVINTNPIYPPINGNWTVLGSPYTVSSNEGECVSLDSLSFTINSNDPNCVCDGSISILASGGVPPYQYSYDNGLSYTQSAIYNGLCGGLYSIKVKDSDNTIVSNTVTLSDPIAPIQYTVSTNLLSQTLLVSTPTTTSYHRTFSLSISPSLPVGVTITLDMTISGQFTRTPYPNSATYTFNSQVLKNGSPISYNDNTTETTTPNTSNGCQNELVYIRNISHERNSITITSTDIFTIETTDTLVKTCESGTPPELNFEGDMIPLGFDVEGYANQYNCCVSTSNASLLSVSNSSITGCDCCTCVLSYTKSLYE